MISDIAPTFKALMDGMAKADPEGFAKIILDRDYDILEGLLIEQKTLGEALASLDEQMSIINIHEFGQILVGQAEVAKTWYEHWRNLIDIKPADGSEKIAKKKKKKSK